MAPPRIAAVRIQPLWSSRANPLVHCTATLTRPLSDAERQAMERFPEFSVTGNQVTFSCRPEETEVSEQRLTLAVAQSAAGRANGRQRRGLRAIP
ncbi:MAG: hypothetical protein M3167_05095 [Acidobacteriota bacterium]|nr:hypothetical protein [Acidobacteriota bacterium]